MNSFWFYQISPLVLPLLTALLLYQVNNKEMNLFQNTLNGNRPITLNFPSLSTNNLSQHHSGNISQSIGAAGDFNSLSFVAAIFDNVSFRFRSERGSQKEKTRGGEKEKERGKRGRRRNEKTNPIISIGETIAAVPLPNISLKLPSSLARTTSAMFILL